MPSDSQRHDALERATELCVSRGLCVFDSPEAMIEFFDLQDVMRLPLGGAAGIVASLKLKQKREEAARSRRHERRKLRLQQDQRHSSDESTPQTPDEDDDDDKGDDDHQSPLLRSSTTALVTCDQDEEPKRPHKNSPPSTQTESASQQLCVVDGKDTPYAGGGEDHEDEEDEDDATTWWRPYFVSASLPSLRDEELAAVCGAMIPTTTTTTTATNNILHDPKLFKRGAVVEGPMPFYLSSMWRSANTTTTDNNSTSSTTCTGKGSQTATSLSSHSSLSTTTGRIVLLPFAFAGAALYVSVTTVANMINTAVVAPVVWSAEKSAGLASWVGEGYRRRWGARNDPFSQGQKCRRKKKAVVHRQSGKRTKNDRTRRGWSQRDEERVLLTKYRVGEVEQLSGWLFDEHEEEEGEGGIRTGPRSTLPTSETDEEYSSSCCTRTPRSDDEGPNAVDREVLSDQSTSQDGSPLSSVVPGLGAMEGLLQTNGSGFSSHTDDGLASPFSQELLRPCEKWGAKRRQHGQQRVEQQHVKQLGNSDEDASSSSTGTDTEDSGADSLVEEEAEGKAYRFIGTAPQIYSSSNLRPQCCQCRCTCGKEKVTPRKPEMPLEASNKEKMSGTPDTRSGEGVGSASAGKTAELSAAAESATATKEEGATVQQGPLTSFPSLSTAAGLVSSFAFSVVDVTRKIVDHVAPTQPRHQSNADDTHAKPNAHLNSDDYCTKCCRCLPSASTCAAANKKEQSTRVSGKGPSEDSGGMGSSHGTETGRGTNGGVDRVIFIPAMQRLSVKVLDKMLPSLTQQEHGESLLSAVDGSFSAPQSQDTSIEAESSAGGGGGAGDGDRSLAGNVPNILPAFSRVFTLDEWIDLLLSLEIKSGEAVTEHLVLTQHLIVFDVDMVIGVLPNKKRGPKDITAEKCNTILLESPVRCEPAPQCVNDASELPSGTSPNAASAPSPPSSSCLLASSSDTAPHKDDDTTARVRVRTLKALYFPLPKGFGRGLLSTEQPQGREQPQGKRLVATGDDDEALSDAKALAAWKYLAYNLSLQVGFWEEALEQALAMSRGLDEEEGTLESSLHQLREQQHAPDDNIDTNGIGQMTKDRAKKRAKEISEKLNDIAKTKATVQRDIDVLSRRIAENKLVAIECEKLRNRLSSSSSSRPVSLREAVVRVEELMHNFGDGPWPRL